MAEIERITFTALSKNVTEKEPNIELDDSKKLVVQFNPESIELGKLNAWKYRPDVGQNLGEAIFSGGQPETLDLSLLFDTTMETKLPKSSNVTTAGGDVRKLYEKLFEMFQVDQSKADTKTNAAQPPHVFVQWGQFFSFVGYIKSIRQEFQLFNANGTPLRARVNVCLVQASDPSQQGGQNPTSRSEARRTWVVEYGQRLDWIAYNEYGESAAWRHIAETNGIIDPFAIRPGQILKLVPLE